MNDPAEEICDALVAYVAALADPDVSLIAEVRKTDNPLGDLQLEHTDLTVLFHAASEAAEKRGRGAGGPYLEHYTVAMLVVRKLDAEFTRAMLAKYVREIKSGVRGVKQAGRVFASDETPVKFDANMRKDLGQFVSVTHFTYSEIC